MKSLTKRQRQRKKLLTYVAAVFCCGLILAGMYSSVFRIVDVETNGAKHTDVVSLKEDVHTLLQGNRFFIFPNNNLFFYPKRKIEAYVLQTYPSIEEVHIKMHAKKIVDIQIKDRKPLGVWCSDECYFYDSEGVVFKKSFKYTGPLFTSWEQSPKTPIQFLETVSCQELCTDLEFSNFLRNNQIEKAVISVEMIELFSSNGYRIKAGFNASTTMSHIRKITEQKPEFLNTLEYVDVRFPTKIFYKEKGL